MRLPRVHAAPIAVVALGALVSTVGIAGCGSSSTDRATDLPSSTPSFVADGSSSDARTEQAVVTTYPKGREVRLPAATYTGAPTGLAEAMKAYLTASWSKEYQHQPGCEQVPLLTVWKVSSAGFARLSYHDDGSRAHGPACAGTGGGDEQLWGIVDGTWQVLVEGQDLPLCKTLHRYAVPDAIAGTRCVDETTNKAIPYHQA
jgi:hypothetical protein